MGKRIKDLTTTSSPANDDYLPVDSANSGTRKISASLITGKQDAIIAGTNITIAADGKTISATDTTYSAGTNVQINNGVISATDTTYSAFTGATSGADGSSGLVPQPLIADKDKFLKGDGTWDTIQPGASALDDLTNVDITSPTNGQVLKYDSTNQEWVNANESGGGGGSTVTITPTISTGTKIADYSIDGSTGALFAPNGSGGASALSDLTDVTLTSPTDGQALVYDATNQEWVNGTVSGGGGSGLTATILSNTLWSSVGTYTLNDDYDNYDILEIYFCNPSVAGRESDLITVMVNDVKALMNDSKILNLTGYGDRYVNCTFSADEFTITASNSGGVQKIVGYKAGGGSEADILGKLDFTDLTAQQIADLKTALGIS